MDPYDIFTHILQDYLPNTVVKSWNLIDHFEKLTGSMNIVKKCCFVQRHFEENNKPSFKQLSPCGHYNWNLLFFCETFSLAAESYHFEVVSSDISLT